jgi:hypothetical protein
MIMAISLMFRINNVRMAIHICDLEKPKSMLFFSKCTKKLCKNGFKPVLLADLVQ